MKLHNNSVRKMFGGPCLIFMAFFLILLIPDMGRTLDYPTKPIQMVVGFAPGGPTSLAARIIAEEVSKELGVPVVVLNKPGASTTIAATFVATSKPDGYTIGVSTTACLSAAFSLMPDITYKLSDFTPIAQHIIVPLTFSVRKDAPWRTVMDFVEDARKNPGKYKAGSDGGAVSLMMQGLLTSENLKVAHMVCKGGIPNVTALLAKEVDISAVALTSVMPQIEAGNASILASTVRLKEYPNVPTIAESGYTGIAREFWNGFTVPAGTPQPIVDKLVPVFKKVISSPPVVAKIEKLGLIPRYRGPQEFGDFLQKEKEMWDKLGQRYKITE